MPRCHAVCSRPYVCSPVVAEQSISHHLQIILMLTIAGAMRLSCCDDLATFPELSPKLFASGSCGCDRVVARVGELSKRLFDLFGIVLATHFMAAIDRSISWIRIKIGRAHV